MAARAGEGQFCSNQVQLKLDEIFYSYIEYIFQSQIHDVVPGSPHRHPGVRPGPGDRTRRLGTHRVGFYRKILSYLFIYIYLINNRMLQIIKKKYHA